MHLCLKIFPGKKINIFLFSLSRDRIKLFVFGLREGKNKENFVFYSFPPTLKPSPSLSAHALYRICLSLSREFSDKNCISYGKYSSYRRN